MACIYYTPVHTQYYCLLTQFFDYLISTIIPVYPVTLWIDSFALGFRSY